jgi:hypothetical protein
MDIYLLSLLLGAGGLAMMAVGGLSQHGHSGGASGHGHGGGHGHLSPGSGHGNAGHGSVGPGHAGPGHAGPGHAGLPASHGWVAHAGWLLAAPRVLFAVLLGLGATGELLRGVLGGSLQLAAAVAGGILFERILIAPAWKFWLRFASNPARTLESTIADEATAVTSFDANGEGIVSIEVDGQVVQVLGRLRTDDRSMGAKVRAGQRLRIEEVNPANNRCTVSVL